MKANLFTILYFFTSSILLAQVPEGTLSMEDPDFSMYFMNAENIPVVKGKILNFSSCNPDSTKITYSIVTSFGSKLQIQKVANIRNDGTFDLQLEYAFPYQQIWLNIGNLFYAVIYAHSNLFIELDAAKLLKKEAVFNGDGVRFLGSDGELNKFMNNHLLFKRQQQLDLYKKISNLRFNRSITYEEFIIKYDSIISLVRKIDNEFNNENPSSYAWIINNERQSEYYSVVCVKNWERTMDNETWEKVKNHKSYIVSNDGASFYNSLFTYLNIKANRDQIIERAAIGRSILDPKNKYKEIFTKQEPFDTALIMISLKNIELLDSAFNPPKADFLKMKIESKDIKEEELLLEIILKNNSTEWCRYLLNSEYKRTLGKLDSINAILYKAKSVDSINRLGQSVAEMQFGAKLYKVSNIKGSELLSNLKQSFQGKALLIDCWATWCSPCLEEMPYSKKLHNDTKDLPIEFIYLCTSNGSNIDKWKSKIAELQIPGIHIFVEETIETELMNLFSVNGFPSYLFIDANGTFVPNAIVRPSMTNKNKVKELLEKTGYSLTEEDKKLVNTPKGKETPESKTTQLGPNSKNIQAKDPASANIPSQVSFEGIGVQFNISSDTILVRNTIHGGPSEKGGLLATDKIIYINDTLVAGKGISYENVMRMLKGPRGTNVKIRVLRQGHKDLIPFEIIHDRISIY